MAHNFQLADHVVPALAAQLTAQMPGAVAAVNADVTDPYTIVAPIQIVDHVPPLSILSGAGFPALAIEDLGGQLVNDLVTSVDSELKFGVIAFIANPDPSALAWQLRRTLSAIALCIQADRKLGGQVWNVGFGQIQPGPMLEFNPADLNPSAANSSGYLSWALLELEVKTTEV